MRKEREESRNRENSLTPVHPDARKKERDSRKRKIRYPPHQPCTDYELPKVECRTPLSPALQSNCFRRCCWKVPYKGCKGVMEGKAPLSREREKGFLFQETRHSKTQQDTIQQDTIQKNKTIQPLQTIDKLDDALGLAKCSQEISFTPLSPCSNSWENKETK